MRNPTEPRHDPCGNIHTQRPVSGQNGFEGAEVGGVLAGGGGGLFLGCEGLPGLLPAGGPVSGGFGLACAEEAEAGAGGVLHGCAVLGPAAGLGEVGLQGDFHAGGGGKVFDGAVERWCGLVAQ